MYPPVCKGRWKHGDSIPEAPTTMGQQHFGVTAGNKLTLNTAKSSSSLIAVSAIPTPIPTSKDEGTGSRPSATYSGIKALASPSMKEYNHIPAGIFASNISAAELPREV